MYESEIDLAIRAARRAGALLRERFGEEQQTVSNHGRDIKLHADREAEDLVLDTLSPSGFTVLAEERGLVRGAGGEDSPCWVVDPLDGTLNFARGIPLSCVSVALVRGDAPVLGVVYDFHRDECFHGVVGDGALLDGQPLGVSATREPGQAVITTGFPVHRDFATAAVQEFVHRVQRFKKVRLLGSAALSCAWVACGRADAYAEDGIMWWDVAAGVALIQAAGGYVDVRMSDRKEWARDVRCAAHPGLWSGT